MNTLKIKGLVKIDIRYANGKLKETTGWLKNTITNAGLAVIAGLAGDVDSQTAFTYLAVGTDSTAESAAQTALVAEITDTGLARASATVTRETTNQANDTLQLYKEWTATGAKTIEEIGGFNHVSAGSMLGRKLTGSKTLANGENLQATYKFIFA